MPDHSAENQVPQHSQQITLGTGEIQRNLLLMGAEQAPAQSPETCGYRMGTFFQQDPNEMVQGEDEQQLSAEQDLRDQAMQIQESLYD